MPRYLVQRTFPQGLHVPTTAAGAAGCAPIIETNASLGVTGVCSYVSQDKRQTHCIYDAPSPEAIRRAAERNKLPVDKIENVTVLDPYFYHYEAR